MNHSSMENHQASPVSQAVIIIDISLLTVGSLAGIFGNGRACVLFWKRRDLRKASHVLFVNLSTVGFLSTLVTIFGWLVLVVISKVFKVTLPAVLCFIITPTVFVCMIMNAITLSLMAMSRQDCVLRPFDHRITQHNVKKFISICWILVLLLASAAITFDALGEHPFCHNFDPHGLLNKIFRKNSFFIYVATFSISLNVAALFVILITFFRIVKKLRLSPIPISNSVQNRREKELRKYTYRACLLFAVCWVIGLIPNLLIQYGGPNFDKIKDAQVLTVTIAKFMYVINPYLHHKVLKARTSGNRMAALKDQGGQLNHSNKHNSQSEDKSKSLSRGQ